MSDTVTAERSSAKELQHFRRPFLSPNDSINLSEQMQWASQHDLGATQMAQYGTFGTGDFGPEPYMDASAADFDCYRSNGLPYAANNGLPLYPTQGPETSCPRSYTNSLNIQTSDGGPGVSASYPPSAYVHEPPNGLDHSDWNNSSFSHQLDADYEPQRIGNLKVEADDSPYGSPYGSVATTRSSTPNDELHGLSRQARSDCNDDSAIDKEQPYAQLIYKALLEAPGHTMILRDIYNWFIKNTDKAANQDSKGWQNSIRHNLSMNGAFEKVDQPCDEARKGFMWKLTDEAILEGVKSTTRYRSKQPNKRGSHRNTHPLPQRQASGAKGGHASRRSAKLRRSQRGAGGYASEHQNQHHRSDMYRSVPTAYMGVGSGGMDGYDNSRSVLDDYALGNPNLPPSPMSYCSSDVDFTSRPSSSASTPFTSHNGLVSAPGIDLSTLPGFTSPPYDCATTTGSSHHNPHHPQSLYNSAHILPHDPSEQLFSPLADPSNPLPFNQPLYDFPGGNFSYNLATFLPPDNTSGPASATSGSNSEPPFGGLGIDTPSPTPTASEPRTPGNVVDAEGDGGGYLDFAGMGMEMGEVPGLYEDVSATYRE